MGKKYLLFLMFSLFFCGGCHQVIKEQTIEPVMKEIEPQPIPSCSQDFKTRSVLPIIGEVEPVYFLPMKGPLDARIDTGAETSSVGVRNQKLFERDGEKWVSFDVKNNQTAEVHHFEKKIKRQSTIRRIHANEERVVVMMDIRFGKEVISAEFTLADRSKFDYPVLIGRNVLNGRFIVDVSMSDTLY